MTDYTAQRAEIDGVLFHFHKMGAMEGWRVLEKIRHAMASFDIGDQKFNKDNKSASIIAGIKTIASLPVEFVDELRIDLFKHIQFQTKKVDGNLQSAMVLNEATIDMAMEKVKPTAIYELIVRALAVNFTESFTDLISNFPVLNLQDGNQ